jgi:nitroreductase
MDILKAVKERRSIRDFQKKEIPEEIVDKLIDALIWAPSAGNLRARKVYFIKDEIIKILNMPYNLRPVLIVPVGYPSKIPYAPPRVSKEEAVEVL